MLGLCQAYFKSEKGREGRRLTPSQLLFMPFKEITGQIWCIQWGEKKSFNSNTAKEDEIFSKLCNVLLLTSSLLLLATVAYIKMDKGMPRRKTSCSDSPRIPGQGIKPATLILESFFVLFFCKWQFQITLVFVCLKTGLLIGFQEAKWCFRAQSSNIAKCPVNETMSTSAPGEGPPGHESCPGIITRKR